MKVTGIAKGTQISTNLGNRKVETCLGDTQLLSKYDRTKSEELTEITNATVLASIEDTVYLLKVANGRTIEVTDDCQFLTENGFCSLFNIPADAKVFTVDGWIAVDKIESKREELIHTVIMQNCHTFVANGFIISNVV